MPENNLEGLHTPLESEKPAKTSKLTWFILSAIVLVLSGPFLLLNFFPAEPPEDKTELLQQLEAENRRSGFSQTSERERDRAER